MYDSGWTVQSCMASIDPCAAAFFQFYAHGLPCSSIQSPVVPPGVIGAAVVAFCIAVASFVVPCTPTCLCGRSTPWVATLCSIAIQVALFAHVAVQIAGAEQAAASAAKTWLAADMRDALQAFAAPLVAHPAAAGSHLLFTTIIASPPLAGPDTVIAIAAGPLALLGALVALAALVMCVCAGCGGSYDRRAGWSLAVGILHVPGCSRAECRRTCCCSCGDDDLDEEGIDDEISGARSWCCCPIPSPGGAWAPITRYWYGAPWWTPLWHYDIDIRLARDGSAPAQAQQDNDAAMGPRQTREAGATTGSTDLPPPRPHPGARSDSLLGRLIAEDNAMQTACLTKNPGAPVSAASPQKQGEILHAGATVASTTASTPIGSYGPTVVPLFTVRSPYFSSPPEAIGSPRAGDDPALAPAALTPTSPSSDRERKLVGKSIGGVVRPDLVPPRSARVAPAPPEFVESTSATRRPAYETHVQATALTAAPRAHRVIPAVATGASDVASPIGDGPDLSLRCPTACCGGELVAVNVNPGAAPRLIGRRGLCMTRACVWAVQAALTLAALAVSVVLWQATLVNCIVLTV